MICQICKREVPEQYQMKHHLTPVHKGGQKLDKIDVCLACGKQIHKLFSNSELKSKYHTLEMLLASAAIQKWADWVSKTKDFDVCMKTKKRR